MSDKPCSLKYEIQKMQVLGTKPTYMQESSYNISASPTRWFLFFFNIG